MFLLQFHQRSLCSRLTSRQGCPKETPDPLIAVWSFSATSCPRIPLTCRAAWETPSLILHLLPTFNIMHVVSDTEGVLLSFKLRLFWVVAREKIDLGGDEERFLVPADVKIDVEFNVHQ